MISRLLIILTLMTISISAMEPVSELLKRQRRPIGMSDKDWNKLTLPKAPDAWEPKAGGPITAWVPSSFHSMYERRVGPKKPHKLFIDIMFFKDYEGYLQWHSPFWTKVFYPFKWCIHASSIYYMNIFNRKQEARGSNLDALHTLNFMYHTSDESFYRGIFLWLTLPLLFIIYISPFMIVVNWIKESFDDLFN